MEARSKDRREKKQYRAKGDGRGQDNNTNKLPRAPSNSAINKTNFTNNKETESEPDQCIICCEEIKVYGLGPCNHRDVCAMCSLRLRELYKDMGCCICKAPIKEIIYTSNRGLNYEGFTLGKLIFDKSLGAYFDEAPFYESVKRMWEFKCPMCNAPTFGRLQDLRHHIKHNHGLVYCDLCIGDRKVFLTEQPLFAPRDIPQHYLEWDGGVAEQTRVKGHPMCQFCRTSFYGNDQLYEHLQRNHFTCHICERDGILYQYYKDYTGLEKHFQSDHFLCGDPECLAKKFVVFRSSLDMKAHEVTAHGKKSKADRLIEVNFRVLRAGRSGEGIEDESPAERLARRNVLRREGWRGEGDDADHRSHNHTYDHTTTLSSDHNEREREKGKEKVKENGRSKEKDKERKNNQKEKEKDRDRDRDRDRDKGNDGGGGTSESATTTTTSTPVSIIINNNNNSSTPVSQAQQPARAPRAFSPGFVSSIELENQPDKGGEKMDKEKERQQNKEKEKDQKQKKQEETERKEKEKERKELEKKEKEKKEVEQRNQQLISKLRAAMDNDQFDLLRQMSHDFRSGKTTPREYHHHFMEKFGGNKELYDQFSELVALLPDPDRRSMLEKIHLEHALWEEKYPSLGPAKALSKNGANTVWGPNAKTGKKDKNKAKDNTNKDGSYTCPQCAGDIIPICDKEKHDNYHLHMNAQERASSAPNTPKPLLNGAGWPGSANSRQPTTTTTISSNSRPTTTQTTQPPVSSEGDFPSLPTTPTTPISAPIFNSAFPPLPAPPPPHARDYFNDPGQWRSLGDFHPPHSTPHQPEKQGKKGKKQVLLHFG